MGTSQLNPLCNRWKGPAKHMDSELGLTVKNVFNFVVILVKIQPYVPEGIIVILHINPILQAVDEVRAECFLIGMAQMQILHVGLQIRLTLGMERIGIDPGADIV